ncbi:uncharacterized protein VTP21DRAFT_3473 [Calcarisporiella thermophila]|uniref:uncharacterized protein n=1 Tax=Calcarisporiella thermophila TaxID=911321 RepID=UPI003744A74B
MPVEEQPAIKTEPGKPCRVCTDFKSWTKQKKQETAKDSPSNAPAKPSITPAPLPSNPPTCPPDAEQLGAATWTFLHTMAAYYPDTPTPPQQEGMTSMLRHFSWFYPCGHCADHLRKEMKTRPPRVETREALSKWMCEVHNEVNERLGKEKFDCSIGNLDKRWRDGPEDGSCD